MATITKSSMTACRYWRAFLDYAYQCEDFLTIFSRQDKEFPDKGYKRRDPPQSASMAFGIGNEYCRLIIRRVATCNQLKVVLEVNDRHIYSTMLAFKQDVAVLSRQLTWDIFSSKKTHNISIAADFDLSDKSTWSMQFDWLVDTMILMYLIYLRLGKSVGII